LVSVLELPDPEIGWFLPAVWKGYWLIRRERIRFIVTSSPPRSVALVGLFLSKITEAKLVTDLRDPWFLHAPRIASQRSWLSDRIETWLELKIMEGSERVVVTTEHYRDFLTRYYSHLPPSRFHTIWNGYDAEDFKELDAVKPNKKLTFSYLGTFYLTRNPKGFLKALSEFIAEEHVAHSEVEVNFVGDVRSCGLGSLEELIRSTSLSACVKIQDTLPYAQALLMMKKSHVLLLYQPEGYYCIPAKAFEYLAAGRRILCFSEEGGATPDLMRKAGVGIVLKPDDVNAIKSAIRLLYLEYKAGKLEDRLLDASMFERDILVGQLSTLLRESLSNNG
jgi:glycosyltransferase involved in cell wall biosynthesis